MRTLANAGRENNAASSKLDRATVEREAIGNPRNRTAKPIHKLRRADREVPLRAKSLQISGGNQSLERPTGWFANTLELVIGLCFVLRCCLGAKNCEGEGTVRAVNGK